MSSWAIEYQLGGQRLRRGFWPDADQAERFKAAMLRAYPGVARAEVVPADMEPTCECPPGAVLVDPRWCMLPDGIVRADFCGQSYEMLILGGVVELHKDDGEIYEVTRSGGGLACTCDDARYRKRECKHVLFVRWARLLEDLA